MSILSRHPSLSLAASQLAVEGAVFLRNLILARLIGAEQMGLAVALALGIRLVEMVGDFGLERLLVQVDDRELSRIRGTTHMLQAIKAVLLMGAVAALAVPMANALGPGLSPAIFVLAAASLLLRGLVNCDYRERQRSRDFTPTLVVEGGSNALALAAIAPIALVTRDYTAMAWASVAQAAFLCLISHAIARRTMSFAIDGQAIKKALRFGLPVACNGALLFLAMQGDRLVIALHFPAEELARFAIAAQLALLPALAGARFVLSYDLPAFARIAHEPGQFRPHYRGRLALVGILSLVLGAGLAAFGTDVISVLYGDAFVCAPEIMALLAAASALRLIRAVPNTVLIATARTTTALLCNVPRLIALPLAFALVANGADMATAVGVGVVSEAIGLVLGLAAVSEARPSAPVPALSQAGGLS